MHEFTDVSIVRQQTVSPPRNLIGRDGLSQLEGHTMTNWHWHVSTGRLEPANNKPDRIVYYVHKGDQLPLRDSHHSEQPSVCSCRTGSILPLSRTGKPVVTDTLCN